MSRVINSHSTAGDTEIHYKGTGRDCRDVIWEKRTGVVIAIIFKVLVRAVIINPIIYFSIYMSV